MARPGGQPRRAWPTRTALPFPNALFDRVLVVHGLEESDNPLALLREVWRVLAPVRPGDRGGRRPARPVGRRRGDARSATAGPSPAASSSSWSARPSWSRWPGRARSMCRRWPGPGRAGPRASSSSARGSGPQFAGLILMEAVKQTFAVKPKGLQAPARVFVPGALKPARVSIADSAAPAICAMTSLLQCSAVGSWTVAAIALALGDAFCGGLAHEDDRRRHQAQPP